jgi:signal recognition particle subunit SRP72
VSNILSIKSQDNPFLTYRTYHSVPKPSKNDRIFQYQSRVVEQNDYTLELLAQKFDGVSRSTSAAISKSASRPSETAPIAVLNAAAHTRNETGSKAIKLLLPLLAERPNDIGLLLTIIQLYILTDNHSAAANLLYSFYSRVQGDASAHIAYTPGLVATAVALFTSQGRTSNARTILSQAAEYWRKQKDGPPPKALLRDAAAKWLEDPSSSTSSTSDPDSSSATNTLLAAAFDIFKHLHDLDPNDRASTAGLVAATAAIQPGVAIDRSLLSQLTPAADLVANIDAEALENAGVARPLEPAAIAGSKRAATDGLDTMKGKSSSKKKKLVPSRRPKDYVEGKELDAERWLPMRERSYFRPKGKKGKGKVTGGLTQGGVVDEKVESATKTPSAGVVGGGSGGVGGQQSKKKKKGKGTKW